MGAEQPGLAILQQHVSLLQLQPAGTQGLDLPSLEGNAGFIALVNEIVVPRPAVFGDAPRAVFLLPGHRAF